MPMSVATLTGIGSIIGGASWTAACFVHNSLPQGCIGQGCVDTTMRGSTPVDQLLFALAGLMLACTGLGCLQLTRERNGLGRLAVVAAATGGVGLLLLGAAGVVSTFIDNDWAGMPGLVVPGILLLATGLVLVAAVVIRARLVPVALSSMLLATALLLPVANEQTSRILLAVPFGLCWLGLGLVLLRRPSDVDQPSTVGP